MILCMNLAKLMTSSRTPLFILPFLKWLETVPRQDAAMVQGVVAVQGESLRMALSRRSG